MEKRTLGRTGLEVGIVGFGAMTIGKTYGPTDDEESDRALHAAVDAGMNFIDTSDAYGAGHSERLIGRFLKDRSDRDRIIICTKGGNNMTTGKRDFRPEYIGGCVDASLKRLGVDAIDVYLLHNPNEENLKAEDSFDLLDECVAKGKIKHWGVSVNTVAECERVAACGRPSVMQMEYNILDQEPAAAFAKARAAGIGVICRVPFKRGFLTGRFDENTAFGDDDRRQRNFPLEKRGPLMERVRKIEEVAEGAGMPMAEMALRFCASNPDVSVIIPGVRTPEQARNNVAAGEPLPAGVLDKLKALA